MNVWQKDNYTITTDKSKLDLAMICQFLQNTYWASYRTPKQIEKSIQHAVCFGVYEHDKQIGFARVITDFTIFAYLGDVFILPEYQKRGLGKWLVQTILNAPELKEIVSWLLVTKDANGLYQQLGFSAHPYPERVMAKRLVNY